MKIIEKVPSGKGVVKAYSFYFFADFRYRFSTFSLAQGVRLKNLRHDFIDGLLLKQLMLTSMLSSFHPYFLYRKSSISVSFTPCNGLLG